MKTIIVSRHLATIQFIRIADPRFAEAPVLASANVDDVRGNIVAGNLPLSLAAETAQYYAVEMPLLPRGDARRGQELTAEDMTAGGATLVQYRISRVAP